MRHRHIHRGRSWVLIGAGIFLGGLSLTSANAETYIAGQVGYTISHDARGVEVIDPQFASPPLPSGTTSSNIDLKNAIMYGMKIGHYFNAVPWLGVEVEGFITTPHVLQQNVTLTIPGSGQATVPQPGATNRLIVVSPNLVARYRAGIFEPYVGVGPGIFLLHTAREPNSPGMPSYSQSSTSVGLNTQVGLRAYVAEHISLFGEWKYNYFHVNQAGQAAGSFFGYSASVNLHHLVFGVGYHF